MPTVTAGGPGAVQQAGGTKVRAGGPGAVQQAGGAKVRAAAQQAVQPCMQHSRQDNHACTQLLGEFTFMVIKENTVL